ncbi:MAG TPA: hypothetical protein VF905_14350 [Nitrospirota bacterium]
MSYTNSWSETSPADTDLLSTGADAIRDTKLDIRERIAQSLAYFNNGSLSFQSQSATATTLVLKAPASASSGNILEFYNTSGTMVWHIDKTGLFVWDTTIAGNPGGQTIERCLFFDDFSVSDFISSVTAASSSSVTGTNKKLRAYSFLNDANSYVNFKHVLPSFYTSSYAVDLTLFWTVIADGGSNAVTWTVETSGMPAAATYDTTYNAAQSVTTNVAANNIVTSSAFTSLTMTGCTASNMVEFKIGRTVSDTSTATVFLLGAKLRIH